MYAPPGDNPADPDCWGQGYGYDRWGNMTASVTKCTAPTFNQTFVNNRVAGWCYDNSGNLVKEGSCSGVTLWYNPENRL